MTDVQQKTNVFDNDFMNRLREACPEIYQGLVKNEEIHLQNKRIIKQHEEKILSVQRKIPQVSNVCKNPALKESLRLHANDVKKLGGNEPHPKFNFNIGAPAWSDELLHGNPDPEVIKELLGTGVAAPTQAMPQQMVMDMRVPLAGDRLFNVAMQFPLMCLNEGIAVGETAVVQSGADVGVHYLMFLTQLMDLYAGTGGEISIFDTSSWVYWALRNSLSPREVKGFSYAFDLTGIPTFEAALQSGIPFEMVGQEYITLAWPTGVEDNFGRKVLTNTIPIITIEDLLKTGISVTTSMMSELSRRRNVDVIENPMNAVDLKGAHAFAYVSDYGVNSYSPYCQIMSEVPLRANVLWIAELGLGSVDIKRRGNYTYNGIIGPATMAYHALYETDRNAHYSVQPRQINLSSFLFSLVAQLIQCDITKFEIFTSGSITQPSESVLLEIGGGELINYVYSILIKRYATSAIIMAGTDPLNDGTIVLGAGYRHYIDYSNITTANFPMNLIEGMADLSTFAKKVSNGPNGKGFYKVYVPYLSMTGFQTRANPLENYNGGSDLSVVSILTTMYQNATSVSYNFASGFLPPLLDMQTLDVAFFEGSGPTGSIRTISDVIGSLQGHMMISPGLANIHNPESTLLYYTYLNSNFDPQSDFDDSMLTTVKEISNRYPLDPNLVADQLTRILPVVFSETDFLGYIGVTEEVKSIPVKTPYAENLLSCIAYVHELNGLGYESAMSDRALVLQHKGGGFVDFFKQVGRTAVPLLSLLGSQIANSYLPGSGGIVKGIGSAVSGLLNEHNGIKVMLKNSHKNPYAPLLRPTQYFPSIRRGGSMQIYEAY